MSSPLMRALSVFTASVTAIVCASAPALAQPAAPTAGIVWVDQFGEFTEIYNSVAASGSSVYVAGTVVGAQAPVYLRKYTDAGSLNWTQTLPGTNSQYGPTLAADASQVCVGGVTVQKFDDPNEYIQNAGFVRCVAQDGTVRGTGYVETEDELNPPLTLVTGIVTSADAVYVVGITDGVLSGSCLDTPCTAGAIQDAFIRKYDATGGGLVPAWSRQVDLGGWDNFLGVALDSSGNVRVWGIRQLFGGINEVILRCYDPDGGECGAIDLPFADEWPFAGAFASDAFYLGTLSFTSFKSVVHRYSLAGGFTGGPDPEWSVSIPSSFVYALASEPGGVVVAGAVTPGHGQYDGSDVLVSRYDDVGRSSWSLQLGSPTNDNGFGVAVDSTRVYVCGQTTGIMKPGTTPTYGADAFLARVARPEEAGIRSLVAQIEALVGDGTLKAGQGASLIVKLEQALEAFEAGDAKKAVTMLEAFIKQVTAFERARILTLQQASELIGAAQAVITQISG